MPRNKIAVSRVIHVMDRKTKTTIRQIDHNLECRLTTRVRTGLFIHFQKRFQS